MKHYRLHGQPNAFQSRLTLDPGLAYAICQGSRGEALRGMPELISLVRQRDEPYMPLGDYPLLCSPVGIVSGRAMSIIEPYVRHGVQWIPAAVEERRDWWLMNVTVVYDLIDESASSLVRVRSGMIAFIDSLVLKSTPHPVHDVFKLRGWEAHEPIVSERVRSAIVGGGLAGFEFSPAA